MHSIDVSVLEAEAVFPTVQDWRESKLTGSFSKQVINSFTGPENQMRQLLYFFKYEQTYFLRFILPPVLHFLR